MITKRVLTLKSKVGFGKYGNEPLGRLIECDCAAWVRFIYYTCETIDYTQEVKEAAQIYISIPKPGTAPDLRMENERKVWDTMKETLGEEQYMHLCNMRRKTKRIESKNNAQVARLDGMWRKGRLARVNQGHGFIKGK